MLPVLLPLTDPEREALLQTLRTVGALPLSGQAWRLWVKRLVWGLVLLISIQFIWLLGQQPTLWQSLGGLSLTVVVLFLWYAAYGIHTSRVNIHTQGITQTGGLGKSVLWGDITFAKFVPMLASKRLIVFVRRGRPLVFQAGTHELEVAFAHIALAFKNRQESH